eukprot:UN05703
MSQKLLFSIRSPTLPSLICWEKKIFYIPQSVMIFR